MGAFLAKPVTDTFPEDNRNDKYAYGSSSMQGFRTTQEDAHMCLLDFDVDTSLFGVFDGHGGAEVAQYTAKKFPDFLKNNESYKKQDYVTALRDAFLEFDASLIRSDVLKELKRLAGDDISSAEEDEDIHNDLSELKEEAHLPLDELLERIAKGKKERQSKLKAQKSIEESISSSTNKSTTTTDKNDEPCSSSSKIVENGEPSSDCASKVIDLPCSSKATNSEVTSTEEDTNEAVGSCSSSNVNNNAEVTNECEENQPSSSNSDKASISGTSSVDQNDEPSSTDQKKRIKPIKVSSQCSSFLQMLDEINDEEDSEEDESVRGSDESDEDESDEFYDSSEESEEDESELDDDSDEESKEVKENGLDTDNPKMENPLRKFMFDEGPGKDSGCTAVVALLKDNKLYVANAGDSRCVLSRNGVAIEMSHDHKPTSEIEYNRIKKAGGRVTSEGRVNGGLNLSRAFGDHSYKVNKDLPLEEQMITALPDIKTIDITPEDDFIVLACDGIWNSMNSKEVVDFINEELKKETKLSKICDQLFFKCLAEDTSTSDGSGCDNQTAIIIKLKDLPANTDEQPIDNGEVKIEIVNENNKETTDKETTDKEIKTVNELNNENGVKRKHEATGSITTVNGKSELVATVSDSPLIKKAKSELE